MLSIEPVVDRSQIDAVHALAQAIWFEHYPGIISWSQVHYMFERGYAPDVIEAEIARGVQWQQVVDGGIAVGFIAYVQRAEAVSIDKLYVKAGVRQRGHARACVDRAERFALDRGCPTLRLTVNKRNLGSIGAYLRLGFSFEAALVKPIGFGFVMDDYVMRKRVRRQQP